MPFRTRLGPAAVLLLAWCAPARAAVFAQADSSVPYVEYGVALVATALVLLVVCWPARRQ
jgi:hypothetical protein